VVTVTFVDGAVSVVLVVVDGSDLADDSITSGLDRDFGGNGDDSVARSRAHCICWLLYSFCCRKKA
jgi:hypothetical protein